MSKIEILCFKSNILYNFTNDCKHEIIDDFLNEPDYTEINSINISI